MKSNSWLYLFILLFTGSHWLNADIEVTISTSKLLVIPFRNNGTKEFNHYAEIFPQSLFAQFRFIPNHTVVNPEKTKHLLINNLSKLNEIDDDTKNFSKKSKVTHIIKGEYQEEKGKLNISFKIIETKFFHVIYQSVRTGKGGIHSLKTIDEIVNEMVKFLGIKLEFGTINVSAEKKCRILIDGEDFGYTPINMQLIAGVHLIQAIYSPDNTTNYEVYNNIINLKKLENKITFIKTKTTLNIRTDLPCQVFIDGEYKSMSPYQKQIICGKKHDIKILYEKPDKSPVTILEKQIISKNGEEISLHIPITGTIRLSSPFPVLASINKNTIRPLPNSFILAPYRKNKIKSYIRDYKWNQTFTFFFANTILIPGQTLTYEISLKQFKKNWVLCLLPAAAQFHNYQSIKASIVLSLFSTFSAVAALSPLLAYLNYKSEYEPMLQEWNEYGSAGKYNKAQVEKARYNAGYVLQVFLLPALAGIFFTWLYSLIDGAVLMQRLHKLLYPEKYLSIHHKKTETNHIRTRFQIRLSNKNF